MAVWAAFSALLTVYLAGAPVEVEDSSPVFAAKVLAKRAVAELIVAAYALGPQSVPMPTPEAPVPPPPAAELPSVPALAAFAERTPARDLDLARALADWLARSATFGPPHEDYFALPTAEVLQRALDGEPFLCDDLARLYARLAPRLGLDVRLVYLWAAEEANHVVVEVYSRDLRKWAVLDVIENRMLVGEAGVPLSAVEAHRYVASGRADAIRAVPNGSGEYPARAFELAAYLRKFDSMAFLLRSDFKRVHRLPRHHPANLLSQNLALYDGSRGWLPRAYYRLRISAEQLAASPGGAASAGPGTLR
ncbi:MAG TPA: transglutaminase domain-containing protein [Longimicrobiaceae bacterium]|nr:transglutaminase domain-containing protein [Longimicrobiaceae bacterium]